MWRYIFALPFLIHGLAHISGFLASWTSADAGYKKTPWVFSSGVFLNSPLGKVFGLLWFVAFVGFIGTAYGIVFGHIWWPQVVIAVSTVSLFVIVPWWNTVPPGAKIGALFNVLSIVVVMSPLKDSLIELIS
jgi:hypothetical protein